MSAIYLDYNATTPVDPAVLKTLHEVAAGVFGNPSSTHRPGTAGREVVDRARTQLADLIGAESDEIVFTSGGSEANNLALKGSSGKRAGGHIISQCTEHPSILAPLSYLERRGYAVTILDVDRHGRVEPAAVENALREDTFLITMQHANNETGSIQAIADFAEIARRHGVLLHTDAAQTLGKIPVLVGELGVDLLTIAGHKAYAPKGVGALYVRRGIEIEPLIHGAGHESGRRAGTEAVPQVAALGVACELAAARSLSEDSRRLRERRERLHAILLDGVPGLALHGHPDHRLPNTLNVGFPGVIGAELLDRTPNVAASTGSACHAGEVRPSPVLEAMAVPEDSGRGALRLSLGKPTSDDEVEEAGSALVEAYRRLVR